jgi:hypothetical protein
MFVICSNICPLAVPPLIALPETGAQAIQRDRSLIPTFSQILELFSISGQYLLVPQWSICQRSHQPVRISTA